MVVFRGIFSPSSVVESVNGSGQVGTPSQSEGSPELHVAPQEVLDTHTAPPQQSLAEPVVPAVHRHASRKRQSTLRIHGQEKKLLPGPSAPQKRRPLRQAGPTAAKRSGPNVQEHGVDTAIGPNVVQQPQPSTSSPPQQMTDEQHVRYKFRKRKSGGNGAPPTSRQRTASLHMPPREQSRPHLPYHHATYSSVPVPDPPVQRSSTKRGSPQPSSSQQRATTSPGRRPPAGPSTSPTGSRTSPSSRSSPSPQPEVDTPHRQRFQYDRSSSDWRSWCDHVQQVLQR